MDFQVYKNKVLTKTCQAGQASVEYILILVVITTAVIGLVSFSDTIKGKIEMQKMNLAIKLAGKSDLKRSDFTFKNVEVRDVEGTGDAAGGAGGRGRRAGRGGAGGGAGEGGGGDGAFGRRTNAGAGVGGEGEGDIDEGGTDQERSEALRRKLQVQNTEAGGSVAYDQKRRKARRGEKKAGDESGLVEEDDESSRFIKTRMEEQIREQQVKEEEMKKWNIMKFLIILAIIFLFIVIILKARNARD